MSDAWVFWDPTRDTSGSGVIDRTEWQANRAPELRALFQEHVYGARPAAPAGVIGTEVYRDEGALGGRATLRVLAIDCGLPHPVDLLVVTPNAADGPAPCFLGMNFGGNFTVLDDATIRMPRRVRRGPDGTYEPSERDRGSKVDTWCVSEAIDRGYAFATFFGGDIVLDDPVVAEHDLRVFREDDRRGPADTGAVMAWSWGMSRMIDHLVALPDLDPSRIAVVGHSRNGKTALLTAAFDERVALAIPSQSGCGGAAPSRVSAAGLALRADGRPVVETVRAVTTVFPHWFARRFATYADDVDQLPVDQLPVDQHCLIALCAPRPVLLSNATEDLWADPDGQYQMLRSAAPAYALFGVDATLPPMRPKVGTLRNERLGYFIRPGEHSMTPIEWTAWLEYADRWLSAPGE